MNYSTLAIILDEKVRLVRCVFSDGGKEYLYKTLDDTIKVDDFVVVDYGIQLKDFKVVKVVEVDCVAELSEGIPYKWIVYKVELDKAKSVLKAEAKLVEEVRIQEIAVKRKQLKEAMGLGDIVGTLSLLTDSSARRESSVHQDDTGDVVFSDTAKG